ncbi:MAG: DUF349 domain-containing protein [Gammaproteobacteria bacterium]|nr:DUF349 domain-containing protein [Gammaproteobacteria bacterium]MDD9896377.1 DUF349 domain-containing protein [Gammaproteobacteria bacterium]MDD9960449.1 DUF349 domain-containing protein [Gammaproteobacteria bacterium]
MAADTLEKQQISWDLQDPDEKLRVLTHLTATGQPDDFVGILAGIEDVGIAAEQLIDLSLTLSSEIHKLITLKTKSKQIAESLIPVINDPNILVDLTLFGTSVHVRKNAVLAISDQQLLTELQQRLAGKDKTVCKILDSKLGHSTAETSGQPTQKAIPKSVNEDEQVKENAAPDPEINPVADLPKLAQELAKLSYKNTARLNSLQNTVNRLRKAVSSSEKDLIERLQKIHESLTEKLAKNKSHQDALKQSTEDLLANLQKALDEGLSHDALPTWDKIQGNISNTSGKLRAALQSQSNKYKTKLNELRDWKIFAATEKKKELIEQMRHLVESKMHASDRSKHISNMHKEWKALGRSNQNEELWREFKKLSDAAYEPCKAYFKQRKQLMADNLKARREICEKLESDLTAIDEDSVNISALNKLLLGSEQDWKKYAPVEQSKIKSLQKRFYGVVNQMRRLRKNALRDNSKQKEALIAGAVELSALEDKQKAMAEAKRLQQEWKKIGPTSYKEDKKYWEQFRAACDKVFAKRNEDAAAARAVIEQAEKEIESILGQLRSIGELEDEALRNARSDYQDLQQAFATALNPRIRRQRKKLLEAFNNLKRKIDTRFKSLPDKKWQKLKNAIMNKVQFLKDLELELFSSKDNSQFTSTKSKLENGAWNELEASGNANLDSALKLRADSILNAASVEELLELARKNEQQIRALCIELEIRANLDTPEEDQALRMQIQLDQLKNGFGKLKPDRKENARYAQDAELQAYCIGPLEQQTQISLFSRLEQAIKKLI